MITDDFAILDTMIADMATADPLFRPSNYWQVYADRLVPSLRREGLRSFRASGHPIYRSMGVTGVPFLLVPELEPYWFSDLSPRRRSVYRILAVTGIYHRIVSRHVEYLRDTLSAFQNAYFQLALQSDPHRDILRISDSCEGNPRDAFHPDGHDDLTYTISFIRYMLEYLWVQRTAAAGTLSSVFELGGGYGGQAEVMLKLNKNMKYVVCDIPPQLYIQEQYLKAVFPGQVTGYLETRDLDEIDLDQTTRITIVAPWQMERLRGNFDLLWNSASFQEMEPDIVENYASILGPMVRKCVYLKEHPEGMPIARKPGDHGVMQPVTLEHYRRYFAEFDLKATEDAVHVTCRNPHSVPVLTTSFYDQMLFERVAPVTKD